MNGILNFLVAVAAVSLSMPSSAADQWSFFEQVDRVVDGQKSNQIAQSELDAAKERSRTKKYNFLPSVSASASQSLYSKTSDVPDDVTTKSLGADVSVNIFRFGADRAARAGATESLQAAEIKRDARRLAADSRAATMIADALAARMALTVYEHRIVTALQSINAADARYRKGLLSEQELAKLKLDFTSLQLAKKSAEREAAQTTQLIESFGGDVPANATWPMANGSELATKIKKWASSLTANHLSIKALAAESRAADAAVTEARSAMLPSIDLGGSWRKIYADSDMPVRDHKEIVASVSVPIFSKFSDSGEYRARVLEASALKTSLATEETTSTQTFKFAVQSLTDTIDEALERERQIATAERLYSDNLQRFQRGLITVNDLSIDEHRVQEAELTAIQTWQKAHTEWFHVAELAGVPAIQAR